MTLTELNDKNRLLLIENKKMSDIVYNVDLIHYQRQTIEQATAYNKMLEDINKELNNKLREIYDL